MFCSSDGVGQVVGPDSHPLKGKTYLPSSSALGPHSPLNRVLLAPGENWQSDPSAPDEGKDYGILGSSRVTRGRGTLAEYITIRADQVVECPKHLSEGGSDGLAAAAALPLAALTAWR